jgi:uroporphyrinogen decarboxylase
MGADILNPIQPNAAGMDTFRIKRTFGNRLSFHGGIETQNVISKGNVLDITLEVKKRIEDLAAGGGYIMAPSHNFQSGISPQKIIAMYEAVQDFGKYS